MIKLDSEEFSFQSEESIRRTISIGDLEMALGGDFKIYNEKDFPTYLPKLSLLYDELFAGGKGFRALLVKKISGHLELSENVQKLLAQTVEFIHNASLLHDDLVDRSPLRRGKTSAWLKFSPEYAVLAGDYLLARVMVNLSSFGNIRLVQYTAEVISDLLEGEWLQDSLVKDFAVEVGQLDRVHNLKTASLFKWCLRAPFLAKEEYGAGLHRNLEEMGTLLGQLFQRSDDLLDFDVRNGEGKNPMGDLRSGYVNSFAAFATKDQSREGLERLDSLSAFKNFLGGEKIFLQKVEEFDSENQRLIDLYKHLSENLPSEYKTLVADLAPLPDILYWRKKPS